MKFAVELSILGIAFTVGCVMVSTGIMIGFVPLTLAFVGCGVMCYFQGYMDGGMDEW